MKSSPFSGKKVKILLMKSLPGKGTAGDVIEVKTHYALHVLIPNGIAVIYDKQVQNQRDHKMKQIEATKAKEIASVKKAFEEIAASEWIVFHKQATDADKLYDTITNKNIVNQLLVDYKLSLHSSHVEMEKIDHIGEYEATVTYGEDMIKIPVKVTKKEA